MKKITATVLFAFTVSLIYCQRTYVGLEMGLSADIFKIVERYDLKETNVNESQLKNVRPVSPVFGLVVKREINSTFYVEAGIFSKTYNQAPIGFEFEEGYSHGTAFKSLVIPAKIGAKIDLLKSKIHLTSNVGLAFVKNYLPPIAGYGSGHGTVSSTSPYYYYMTNYNYTSVHHAKSHLLLLAGIGLDFKINRFMILSLAASHYQGFKEIISHEINYSINTNAEQQDDMYSKGSMLVYNIGLNFSLPPLTKNKPVQVLPKINL